MLRQALIFFLLFYSLWQGTVSLSDASLAWAVFILFELFVFFLEASSCCEYVAPFQLSWPLLNCESKQNPLSLQI